LNCYIHSNPYGLGLGSKLFWPTFFKNKGIHFWALFAEKFGGPTIIGKYSNEMEPKDREDFLEYLSNASQLSAAIVPLESEVELLQASQSGAVDTYSKFLEYMDAAISKAVLGETLTTQMGGTGSYAASQTHNAVRLELVKSDADLLSNTLNESLLTWLTWFHFPGANPPRIWRRVEEAFDAKAEVEKDQILVNMGFDPDEAFIQEKYGDGWSKRAGGFDLEMPTLSDSTELNQLSKTQPDGADDPGMGDSEMNQTSQTPDGDSAAQGPITDDIQGDALSGIQITSMMQVVGQVATGVFSRQTAYHILRAAFPRVAEGRINGMLDGVTVVKQADPVIQEPAPAAEVKDTKAEFAEADGSSKFADMMWPDLQKRVLSLEAEFAEFDRKKDSAEAIVDRLEIAAANAMDGLLEPVRRLVASATSYEEILEELDAMYPEMDNEEFQRVLGNALFAANLAAATSVRRRNNSSLSTTNRSHGAIHISELLAAAERAKRAENA